MKYRTSDYCIEFIMMYNRRANFLFDIVNFHEYVRMKKYFII